MIDLRDQTFKGIESWIIIDFETGIFAMGSIFPGVFISRFAT